MIKVAPRASVTDDFKDLYVQAVTQKMRLLRDRLEALSPQSRKMQTLRLGPALGRMSDILKGVKAPGRGLDYEITQLRSLAGYEKFGVGQVNGDLFFVGGTQDIIAEELGRGNKKVGEWDVGPYRVCIPLNSLLPGRLDLHMIPERAPFIEARHFHHVAYPEPSLSPMKWKSHTCWSQFGTPVGAAVQALDIPELFRLLYIFVGRYYNGSPLVSYRNMTFAKRKS